MNIVCGNWKMNTTLDSGLALIEALSTHQSDDTTHVMVCPPHIALHAIGQKLTGITLGAQAMSEHTSGAYTGDCSAEMLKSVGCDVILIGHSERREHHHESNASLNAMIKLAQASGLKPIYCIGESLEQRESNQTNAHLKQQLDDGLDGIDFDNLVVAYEPIWAIGTGKVATPEQTQETHAFIRSVLAAHTQTQTPLLYGGSVNPGNCGELIKQADINGFLVGGASLKADQFSHIITTVKESSK